jgi:hypothetical protein
MSESAERMASMPAKNSSDAFSAEEINHYKNMVGLLIHGDPERKERLDTSIRSALAQFSEAMPDASKQTLVAFCASVAFLMAKIMNTTLLDISDLSESIFDNYVATAAVIMGAYELDSNDLPDVPEHVAKRFPGFAPGAQAASDDLEAMINRQYL